MLQLNKLMCYRGCDVSRVHDKGKGSSPKYVSIGAMLNKHSTVFESLPRFSKECCFILG